MPYFSIDTDDSELEEFFENRARYVLFVGEDGATKTVFLGKPPLKKRPVRKITEGIVKKEDLI